MKLLKFGAKVQLFTENAKENTIFCLLHLAKQKLKKNLFHSYII